MIVCLFLSFLTSSTDIPQYSIIFVSSEGQNKFESFVELLNNNKNKLCQDLYRYEYEIQSCEDLYAPLQNAIYTTGRNINSNLKKVSESAEFLFIIVDEVYETIDFNNLIVENVVFLSYDPYMYYNYGINKLDLTNIKNYSSNTIKAIQRITSKIYGESAQSFASLCGQLIESSHESNRKTSADFLTVSIEGNIKSKVSFLSISNINLKIIHNDLNIHTLYSYNSRIDSNSLWVGSTNFIANPRSYSFDKVHVEQWGLIMYDEINSFHMVNFREESWCVKSTNDGLDNDYCFIVPKTCANYFNWIVRGRTIYLSASPYSIGEKNNINISIIYDLPRRSLLDTLSYYNVEIIPYGNWSKYKNKPKVTINYDKDLFHLDYNMSVASMFSIEEESPYSYKPINRKKKIPVVKKQKNSKMIGIICGILFVIACTILFVTIAIIYRPKNHSSEEEQLKNDIEDI